MPKICPIVYKKGKKYNVSDNGIRRWCEHYNLPTSKKYLQIGRAHV